MLNSHKIQDIDMKKITLLCLLLWMTLYTVQAQRRQTIDQLTNEIIQRSVEKYKQMADHLKDGEIPCTYENNQFRPSDIYWWCSGFYPGTLWYLYEYSHDESVRILAEKYTSLLSSLQYKTTDHDIGFQLFCSFGNGYRLTNNPDYLMVLFQGAHSLSKRFNSMVGCTRSWDHKQWHFPVIIDNMMNLELLMWVGNRFNDNYLKTIAITHANTTLRNHIRPDGSSFHLVDYDPLSGDVLKKQTVQGYSDVSKWARGQAWALYGFTMMYRMTQSTAYLKEAEKLADLLIPLLPADGIPYWDYDSPKIPDDYRDASAASIMASALVELSNYVPKKSSIYRDIAEKQIRTLASSKYFSEKETNGFFLLKHSVGNKPGNSEVDVPLTYTDYYFIEALLRLNEVR